MFSKIDPPYRTKDEDFHFFITVENGEHSYLTVPAPLSSLAFPIISFITITFILFYCTVEAVDFLYPLLLYSRGSQFLLSTFTVK